MLFSFHQRKKKKEKSWFLFFFILVFLESKSMERYEIVKDIGSGNFGVAKLARDKSTNEFFAVKFIERGLKVSCSLMDFSLLFPLISCTAQLMGFLLTFCIDGQIDEHVQREIMNHRSLKHPNIIRFKEVTSFCSPVMLFGREASFFYKYDSLAFFLEKCF